MKLLTLQLCSVPLAVALTPSIGRAQSTGVLLRQGDALSTGEHVVTIQEARIGDDGSWLALVVTDLADFNQDTVLLRDGVIVLREGSALLTPAGTTLDDWDELDRNGLGDLGMILRVKPPVGVPFDGAYWNGVEVAQRGEVIESPHLGVPTDWDSMAVGKLNSSNTMFLLGEVANPAVPRAKERALVRYQLDSSGNVLTTTVLATEGMTVPAGLTLSGATCLGNNEGILAVNERGDFLTFVSNDTTSTQALLINMQQIVAQTGQPSPVGKPWRELSLSRVALNDRGDYVITGAVETTGFDGYLIVKNNQKFAQQGDILPGFATNLMTGSQAPLYIANSGDVFWHARVLNSDSFMRNLDVIVQAQSTVIGGLLVTAVAAHESAFHSSRDGRFWAGLVQLQGVGDALVTVDFGLVVPVTGCEVVNAGVLSKVGGDARAGTRLSLEMDGGQASGVLPALFFCSLPSVPGSPCGVVTRAGEVLVDFTSEVATRVGSAWTGTPSRFDIDLPLRMSLVGLEFFAQGVFWDAAGTTGAPPLRLTNGLRLQIGAP